MQTQNIDSKTIELILKYRHLLAGMYYIHLFILQMQTEAFDWTDSGDVCVYRNSQPLHALQSCLMDPRGQELREHQGPQEGRSYPPRRGLPAENRGFSENLQHMHSFITHEIQADAPISPF